MLPSQAREQFEDNVFYYSCYLVLYNGSRETSSDVEIDPPGEGVYLYDIDCVRVWSIAILTNQLYTIV